MIVCYRGGPTFLTATIQPKQYNTQYLAGKLQPPNSRHVLESTHLSLAGILLVVKPLSVMLH
jgi:hypothetical protein